MRGKIPISNQNDKKSSKLHLKKHVNSRKKKIRQQRRKTLIKGGEPPKTGVSNSGVRQPDFLNRLLEIKEDTYFQSWQFEEDCMNLAIRVVEIELFQKKLSVDHLWSTLNSPVDIQKPNPDDLLWNTPESSVYTQEPELFRAEKLGEKFSNPIIEKVREFIQSDLNHEDTPENKIFNYLKNLSHFKRVNQLITLHKANRKNVLFRPLITQLINMYNEFGHQIFDFNDAIVNDDGTLELPTRDEITPKTQIVQLQKTLLQKRSSSSSRVAVMSRDTVGDNKALQVDTSNVQSAQAEQENTPLDKYYKCNFIPDSTGSECLQ